MNLKEKEDNFRKYSVLLDSLPVGLVIADLDGKIFEPNQALGDLLGYDPEQLIGKSLGLFIMPEDIYSAFLHLRKAAETKKPMNFELKMKGKEYERIPVLAGISLKSTPGEAKRIIISFTDISQTKKGVGLPKEIKQDMSALLDNSEDAVVRFDRKLRHVYVNRAVEKITGLEREYILGKTYRELGYPEDLCDFWDKKILHVFRKKTKKRFEYSLSTPEGYKFFESLMVPEMDERKSVKYVLSLVRDVTERRAALEKVSHLNKDLQKIAHEHEAVIKELESFTSAVSHDLRAPLRSLKGFSSALLEDYFPELDKKGKDYLSRIRRAVWKMESLIDSLMELSRLSKKSLDIREVDLSAMAEKFAAELRKSRPGRHVDFVIQEGIAVRGDFELMEIAIQNLFRNAWKFTEKEPAARIELGLEEKNGKRCIYVKDNGVGFDMTYADKLFQPFQRLHSQSDYPGSGIGLATVRRIIRRHGGEVWAHGEPGCGAVFYFTPAG